MKRKISLWFKSNAWKIGMVFSSILLLIMAWLPYGASFLTERNAELINNILIGIATNLLGIVVTVSFVQFFIDKKDKDQERKEEVETIKRYHRHMKALIRRYLMSYVSLTTRLVDRDKVDIDDAFTRDFKLSDMADMYKTTMFLSEGFTESSIEFYCDAEHKLRDYMLKMIENIDFKYSNELKDSIQNFVEKSADLDMSGILLDLSFRQKHGIDKAIIDSVEKTIADENEDWVEKFGRGELKGNLMLPYVILFFAVHDQVRMIKEYSEIVERL